MKRNIRRATAVLALLSAAASLPAEAITLDEAQSASRAVSENLRLQSRRVSLDAEQREIDTAWNRLLPSLSAGGTLSRANEERAVQPPAEPYHTTASASVSAEITLTGGTLAAIQATEEAFRASRLSYEEARQEVEREARKLFYFLLLQRERIGVGELALDTAEENRLQTRSEYETGRVDSRTLRRAELAVEQATLSLEQTRAEYEDSLATFRSLLGIDDGQEIELDGRLPVEGPIGAFLPALSASDRADVAALRAEMEAKRMQAEATRRDRLLPALSVRADYAPLTADPFNPDNEALYGEWSDQGSLSVSLRFGLDGLLSFSRQGVAENSARAAQEALRLEQQEAIETAEREYESLLRRIDNARSALRSRHSNLELAEEVYELTVEAFEHGTTDFTTVLEAQTELEEERLAVLDEAYTLKSRLIDLEYVSGQAQAVRSDQGVSQ